MKQKRYTVDQIIRNLREADVDLGKNKNVPEICKKLGVSVQTQYRWRQKWWCGRRSKGAWFCYASFEWCLFGSRCR